MKDTPGKPAPVTGATLDERIKNARTQLDAQVREIVRWHFSPDTGTPVLAGEGQGVQLRPAQGRQRAATTSRSSPLFEDEWLRGGPVQPLDARRG